MGPPGRADLPKTSRSEPQSVDFTHVNRPIAPDADDGGAWERLPVLIVAAAVVILGGTTVITLARSPLRYIDNLEVGQCFNESEDATDPTIELVDCDQPHDAQVFATDATFDSAAHDPNNDATSTGPAEETGSAETTVVENGGPSDALTDPTTKALDTFGTSPSANFSMCEAAFRTTVAAEFRAEGVTLFTYEDFDVEQGPGHFWCIAFHPDQQLTSSVLSEPLG